MSGARPGNVNRKARAIARRKAEAGAHCWRCGRPIDLAQPKSWHAGHIVDDALGGEVTESNIEPEHARCNTAAGGRLAQTLKAADKIAAAPQYRPAFWFPARTRTRTEA